MAAFGRLPNADDKTLRSLAEKKEDGLEAVLLLVSVIALSGLLYWLL